MDNFANLLNFRDLGGHKAACGRVVRPRRLLRAALPAGLSAEDVAKLREYNLKYIVDFRTAEEVATSPTDTIDGVAYTHIDIMGDNAAQAANPFYWMELFLKDPPAVVTGFTETYRQFATSPHSIVGYAAFLRSCVAAAEGATLFHCTAGKDRTGFGAAILLKILGISDEDIFADYLKSQDYIAAVNDYYVEKAKKRGLSDTQLEQLGKTFGIMQTSYLQAAFDALEKTFGGFTQYVNEGLGITNEEIAILQEHYLEHPF